MTSLLRRELALVFGARATWVVLALSAVLVGHGFVLALDLFSAASRSALEHALMRRELDPLAGVVRPTLGGLHLAVALLLPVVAARGLGIEKERRSFGMLALRVGSTERVVAAKLLAASIAGLAMLVAPMACVAVFVAAGGHVDLPETAVALVGHALHIAVVAAASVAAAAGTRTVAQATTLGICVSLASWAIEASDGFAALAWMGSLEWASIGRKLGPLEQGVLDVGALAWLGCLAAVFAALAFVLAGLDGARRRAISIAVVIVVGLPTLVALGGIRRAYDWTEHRRASLPPAVVTELRSMPESIEIEVWLDRDDGRRAQVERDAFAKLRLARPDVRISTPLDEREAPELGVRENDYGRIVIRVGDGMRETTSTSRKELITLLFEAAGRPLPEYTQPTYPGYPLVLEGRSRTIVVALAYAGIPGGLVVLGWLRTRRRRRPS